MFTLSHCTSDDIDDLLAGIDLTDPDALLDAVNVANATVVAGDPPAPSTDPDAPDLDAVGGTRF